MIDREHDLPLTRQAEVLKLSRSSLYYLPRPVAPTGLAVMWRIDELHLDCPFAGSRMLRDLLRGAGVAIGRDRVATMMKRMGIEAIYRRPNTLKPAPGHKIYPYRGVSPGAARPNHRIDNSNRDCGDWREKHRHTRPFVVADECHRGGNHPPHSSPG